MSRKRWLASGATVVAFSGFVHAAELPDNPANPLSVARVPGMCAPLVDESLASIREAKGMLVRRLPTHPSYRIYDTNLEDRFRPGRLCVEGPGGAWALVFSTPRRTISDYAGPGTLSVFLPWKLVHVDRLGARLETVGLNPFVTPVRLPIDVQESVGTLEDGAMLLPEVLVGDFDGTGREQAIVMTVWPDLRDPGREPDPEYGDLALGYWPREAALGVAYLVRGGRIEARRGLEGSWLTSVRRRADSNEWDMKSYGPFFQFVPAAEFDICDGAYPVFGPVFTVFRGGSDGLTLDDPRQVPLLRAQCGQALRQCGEMLPVDHVAILDAVCERVPGAALLRANKECAHSIAGAQRSRPAAWFERFRRIPVPGVPRRTQRKPKPYRARVLWEYPVEVQRSTCTWEPLPRRPENE